MSLRPPLCLAALLFLPAAAAPAQEDKPVVVPPPEISAAADAQVEGMLFFASNEAAPPLNEAAVQVDAGALAAVSVRLGKVFPYKHFHLIGKHRQKVFKEYESWVVPSKDLCLKIDSRGPADKGGVNVHLQLWQDKKVLVKSDATITPGRPIFLGGPDWRGGRLVFVVMLK